MIAPWDVYNQELVRQVHPSDWINPTPAPCYNLVVVGAGTAGLVSAAGAAALGARVALVERHLMGGDCLNVGCVPSKTFIRSAHTAAELRRAAEFGVKPAGTPTVNFGAVMERVRRLRASMAPHDSAARFRDLGVDVFLGDGRFVDGETVVVDGRRLRFRKAVIATGARAGLPQIPGLAEARPLTNETLFNLTEQPRRLAIIGGGPMGCEMAQSFQRLGTQVVMMHDRPHVLEREDPDAAAIVQAVLRREGVELILGARLQRVERRASEYVLRHQTGEAIADVILVAAGRIPNITDLGLETAGVSADAKAGIQVDDFLRTTNPRIYACGDVAMKWKFTHAADFGARIIIQNALFAVGPFGRRRLSTLTMPWCTFTDPEIAHVGLYEAEAREGGRRVDTYLQSFAGIDRAMTDGAAEGFVKIHTRGGSDRILGATVVGPRAGDLVSEISVAMAGSVGLGRLAGVIHPYPTVAEAIRKCGDQYNRSRLTPVVKRIFNGWLAWQRRRS